MNYRVEQTDPTKWSSKSGLVTTEQGYNIQDVKTVASAFDFLKVPRTLVFIDHKYGTDTMLPVLRAAMKPDTKLDLLLDDNDKVISVIDPRSKFVDDNKFQEIRERFESTGISVLNERNVGLEKSVEFDLNIKEDLKVLGDLFKRSVVLYRSPEGGVYFSVNLTRLICTNGCMVNEASSRKNFRSGEMTDLQLHQVLADAALFDVDAYMQKKFSKDGHLYLASVEDFLGMKRTLASITDKDVADSYFPEDPIKDFYNSRNIDITKISQQDAAHLSSGLAYYDVFNILTHAVKENKEISLAQQLEVGKWFSKNSRKLVYRNTVAGQPHFNKDLISSLKGDTK